MYKITPLLLMIFAVFSARAVEVNNTAGNLSALLTDVDVQDLVVTGSMDVRDFDFVAQKLDNLSSLDIKGVSILSYTCKNGEIYLGEKNHTDNDVLPAMCFFGKTKYSHIILPAGLVKIGEGAMAGCLQLTSIELPSSLEEIGEYAFNGSGLTKITVPPSVRSIGVGSFSSCPALAVVNIDASKDDCEVGKEAFAQCPTLQNVMIGQYVSTIGDGAFRGCASLGSISLAGGNNLHTIGNEAFMNSAITDFDFTACGNLAGIGDWAFANTQITKASIPESLQAVGAGVYFNNTKVTEVVMSNNVVSIGKYAFAGCEQVKSIIIPGEVATIDDGALSGMTALRKVTARSLTVPALGEDVFADTPQPLCTLYVDKRAIDNYRAAEQWKEFDILTDPSSSGPGVHRDDAIKAYFTGTVLNIETSTSMRRVQLVDAGGVLISTVNPDNTSATIETASFQGNLYLLHVTVYDGSEHIVKLLRK